MLIHFIDAHNRIHRVNPKDKLGEGGQGVVFKTKDGDMAIKLKRVDSNPITDKDQIRKYHRAFEELYYKAGLFELMDCITLPLSPLRDEEN
ncbi:hypothetical protein NHP200010_15740 [Helicobacter bizzozeronii]|nr:hypothetical protein NHP200010_15740 [Helicobacter bizzozeronii]